MVRDLAPAVFLAGLALGVAIWVVDRLWPHVTGRIAGTPTIAWFGLGLLIFLGARTVVLTGIGFLGLVVPSPFLRFRMS